MAIWWPWEPYWQSDDFIALHYAQDLDRALRDFTGPQYGATDLWWFYRPFVTLSFWLEQAIAGADSKDPTCTADPVPAYADRLTPDLRGLRVGIPRRHFTEGAHADVGRAYGAALGTLRELGATTVDVDVPHAQYATSAGWVVAMAEAAQFHERRLRETPELFDPIVRERLDAARFYAATDYIKAMRVRTLLMDEMAAVLRFRGERTRSALTTRGSRRNARTLSRCCA